MFRSTAYSTASLLVAICLGMASPSAAATIDFDDLGVVTGGAVDGSAFISRGYLFSSSEHLHVINDHPFATSWNGTAWLGVAQHGPELHQVTLTKQDGGLFDLLSLEISEFFAYPNQVEVQVIGTGANGTVTRLLKVDDLVVADGPGPLDDFGLVTFDSSWQDLSSVVFVAADGVGGRWYALDNIVTGVPEPSPLMLLSSLGIMVLSLAGLQRMRT